MKKRKNFIAILLLLFIVIPIIILFINFFGSTDTKEDIFYEKIPGSKFHSPDATWWGYNQSKIVRFKDLVFMYVIENSDDSNKTISDFVIYKKAGNFAWEKGASFPTSRPGNILIDSTGVLHAFVFEPTDVIRDDSRGKLMHYFFPNSRSGDIASYQEEIVANEKKNIETVNIRVGAAISENDTMALGFGLTTYNPLYQGHSEHLYFKKPQDSFWTHLIAGENLGHDFYYPFVISSKDKFYLLPIQDDFNEDGNPKTYDNIYQKIIYFEYSNARWEKQIIADLSSLPIAKIRPRLLEQSDFFQDSLGRIHILYKEFLHPQNSWQTTTLWHLVEKLDGWERKKIPIENNAINWVRLVEIDSTLYYLASSWNNVFIMKVDSEDWMRLDIPQDIRAIYPYIATGKNSTKDKEKYTDVLLLGADPKEYNANSHYYLRIPNSQFQSLK